jgi:hypothetical protein
VAYSRLSKRPLPHIAVRFDFENVRYVARFARDETGRPVEVFLDGGHVHNTTARLVSLLLQNGVDLRTIRRAVIGGPLAMVLDRILALDDKR